ncbi:asparagine--tRNA ligase [Candidatus Pacearchaeota archaeon CG_4_9_14_3_um_filter_31_7]|nr:MAG: asparagine--tRNA ligase [Candidatus Pacearchaeota archaeon CG1_02_31_27]PIN92027.1 MAG: asparagine--tRNA ligase [Candidatus Pacearchaeota archaeon CG10_big_fil_rev_8_21_14_0_10_31_59]PIZ81111.1 MAG: asparagine--tRNA ligase [Candidatus Pacearchaeota archaeon CG_4_10_14_0_2_um_filter_31_10]PJA70668.1 MAG: asparagine--tRNA ligase [Candidatus Pacearchaeota archaeon CG_4_9_14_3_um_filter_31_7]
MKEKFISIQEAIEKAKGKVSIRGWVHRERKQKDMVFIVLRDSSDIIQCVIKKDTVSEKEWNDLQKVLIESSMEIEGDIKEEKRAPTGFEIEVLKLKVISYSEIFPITKDLNEELLLDRRHLWLRSRKMTAIMKIRSTVFGAIHEYFRSKGFYEYQSPIFQSVQCEGGSTLFHVDYFGKKDVFLAQTWQLYAEPEIFALEKIYTIAPSFRAEASKTSRHLTEYWHAEMEVAWANFDEIIKYGEELIKHVVKKVLENNKSDLEILERDVKKLEPTLKKKFPRITYAEVLKLLKEKFKMEIPWGKDLRTIEEDKLSSLFDTPVAVTRYPKQVKAFYMKEPDDSKKDKPVVNGVDFIAPENYGEIIGGSERESDIEKIKKRLKEEGEKIEQYDFYLDTRRYGSVPHGGFGLGVERFISWICGLENIKDAIPFPRTMNRTRP